MKFGFLLTHGPFSDECRTVVELASASVDKGMDTELFIMIDGAYALSDPRIKTLTDKGVKVTYCFHNAEQRESLPPENDNPFVRGGIPEFSGILAECDRIFSF